MANSAEMEAEEVAGTVPVVVVVVVVVVSAALVSEAAEAQVAAASVADQDSARAADLASVPATDRALGPASEPVTTFPFLMGPWDSASVFRFRDTRRRARVRARAWQLHKLASARICMDRQEPRHRLGFPTARLKHGEDQPCQIGPLELEIAWTNLVTAGEF